MGSLYQAQDINKVQHRLIWEAAGDTGDGEVLQERDNRNCGVLSLFCDSMKGGQIDWRTQIRTDHEDFGYHLQKIGWHIFLPLVNCLLVFTKEISKAAIFSSSLLGTRFKDI